MESRKPRSHLRRLHHGTGPRRWAKRFVCGVATASGVLGGIATGEPLVIEDPNYGARLITTEVTGGGLEYASDGLVYYLTNLGGGPPQNDEDSAFFSVDPETGEITSVGPIRFVDPATADVGYLTQGPGGDLGTKMYAADWILGNGCRIDRFELDLSDPEAMFRIGEDNDPVHTLTSRIAFSSDPKYLNAGYFCAQGSGSAGIWRFGIVPETDPFLWTVPAGVQDNRGIAFGPGGAWGDEMYVISSSVQNGFDDAPGTIRKLISDGVGNFGSEVVFISEASELLEFGVSVLFDTVGLFDGDMLYLQFDRKLLKISAAAEVSLLATGVRTMTLLPSGALCVKDDTGLYQIEWGTSDIDDGLTLPARLVPGSSTPNPFASTTEIHFSTSEPDRVWLSIFDVNGRKVRTLIHGSRITGDGRVSWDGSDDRGQLLRSGVYSYLLSGQHASESGRVVLLR